MDRWNRDWQNPRGGRHHRDAWDDERGMWSRERDYERTGRGRDYGYDTERDRSAQYGGGYGRDFDYDRSRGEDWRPIQVDRGFDRGYGDVYTGERGYEPRPENRYAGREVHDRYRALDRDRSRDFDRGYDRDRGREYDPGDYFGRDRADRDELRGMTTDIGYRGGGRDRDRDREYGRDEYDRDEQRDMERGRGYWDNYPWSRRW